jgi:hypothetical protein
MNKNIYTLNLLDKEVLIGLVKKYPSWFELGNALRKNLQHSDIVKIYPNDYNLARVICQYLESKYEKNK